MPYYAHPVPAPLRGYVESVHGYDFRLDPDAVHHGLPSPSVTLVVSFDEPLDCGWLGDSGSGRYWTLASGLHHRPALIRTHGRQHGIQLGLTPAGSRALLGVPAGAIGSVITDHDALPGGVPADLHGRLAEAGWPERFGLLFEHLLTVAGRARPSSLRPEVDRAWWVLTRRPDVPVAKVAEHLGWSRRRLHTVVRGEYGLSPKQLAGVARFSSAHALATAGVPLAEVAGRVGYADQAHLTREWRARAGLTPTATLADAVSYRSVEASLDG